MKHVEQIYFRGETITFLNFQDLLYFINDQMGSHIAALVEREIKEIGEENEDEVYHLREYLLETEDFKQWAETTIIQLEEEITNLTDHLHRVQEELQALQNKCE